MLSDPEGAREALASRLATEREAAERAAVGLVAPPPEHTSRDPWPDGFPAPSGAAGLRKMAEAEGWAVRVQYARGSVVTRRKGVGQVIELRHSVAVVMEHRGCGVRAVAIWEAVAVAGKLAWKASAGRVWGPGELPAEVGVAAVKERVRCAGQASDSQLRNGLIDERVGA